MTTRLAILLLAGALLVGCTANDPAQDAVDRAIEVHGLNVLDRAEVDFGFRDEHYHVRRDDGEFRYERSYSDTVDVITNDGPVRFVQNQQVDLSDEDAYDLETTVNSVVYFAFLPYRLNDPAVNKRDLGSTQIDNEPYQVVEVTFDEEGGGRDHDDRFVYWFHKENHTLDYLAYYFFTDDGGSRFRAAQNRREINGTTVQDYRNYEANPDTIGINQIEQFPDVHHREAVTLVSEIELEDLSIRPLD